MIKKGTILKQFCKHGHDTFICGRTKDSACISCKNLQQNLRKRKDPTKDSRIKQFCVNGHDTFIYGRYENGHCKKCLEENYIPVVIDTRKTQFCPKGHNKDIVGRTKRGACIECDNNRSTIYYQKNTEECNVRSNKYREEHLEQIREYVNKEYANNIQVKLARLLRGRLYKALKRNIKPASAIKMLGCTIEFLKEYLESKFLPGMTWKNHGYGEDKWHIDHILPLDGFNLTNVEQFSKACHYTNLQPLWQPDNLRKSNKILN